MMMGCKWIKQIDLHMAVLMRGDRRGDVDGVGSGRAGKSAAANEHMKHFSRCCREVERVRLDTKMRKRSRITQLHAKIMAVGRT